MSYPGITLQDKDIQLRNSLPNGYKADLDKAEPLEKEEEYRLIAKGQKGCLKSKEKVIKANLRFVVRIANEFRHSMKDFSDLVNAGNMGLLEAFDKFDVNRGFKFYSYAVWYIKCYIHREIKSDRVVRIPFSWFKDKYVHKVKPESSLNLNMYNEDGSDEILDAIECTAPLQDESIYENEERKIIFKVIQELDEREKMVILNYFGFKDEERTLEDIGFELGITRERVRQIRNIALAKLKKKLVINGIRNIA